MALTIGELTGYITLDDRGLDQGLDGAHRRFERFQVQLLADLEAFGADAGRGMGAGLLAGLRGSLDDAEDAARQAGDDAGDGLVAGVRAALAGASGDLRRAGDDAGGDLGDGLVRGADDAIQDGEGRIVAAARQAGEEAGDAAGDAMGDSMADSAAQGGDQTVAAAEGRLGMLRGAAAGIGLAAGALLMQGMTDALDQGRIVSRMEATMGTTPELARQYGKVAGRLFADAVTEDFQTAADAVAETMNFGLLPVDATMAQIEAMSTGLADVANLMGEEIGPTARAVGKMIRTGLVDDGAEALDILTRGVQLGANEAEDLLDTYSEYSTQFRQLGLDGDQAMGILVQGLRAGARDADVVADSLKEATLLLQEMGEGASWAVEELGLSARGVQDAISEGGPAAAGAIDDILDRLRAVEDPADRGALAVEIFGTKAEDMQDALEALDPSEAAAALGDFEGAAERAGDTLRDNAATRVEQFKRSFQQGLVNFLGDEVIPALQDLRSEYGPALDGMGERARAAWTRLEPVLREVRDGLSGLRDGFRGVADGSTQDMGETERAVYQAMMQLGELISTGTQLAREAWNAFGEDIVAVARRYWGHMAEEVMGALRIIGGFLQIWAGIFSGDWSRIWEGIKDVFGGALDIIKARWQDGLGNLRSIASGGMALVTGAWNAGWEGMKRGARAAWDWIWGDTRDYASRMVERVREAAANFVSTFTGLPGKLMAVFGKAGEWLEGAGRAIIAGLIRGLDAATFGLISRLTSLANTVRSFWPFSPAKRGPLRQYPMDEAGHNLGAMLAEGLGASTRDIAAAATAAAGAAVAPMSVPGGPVAGGVAGPLRGVLTVRVVHDVTGGSDDLARVIRGWVQDNGGGNVQMALGG
ncbi:phage tail tape measure protein [Streptomyces sp. DSM 44917]|uniref:Phage tail tape measure protein n=1 Tax=Streptomyces boetiae TaxID=3075541 RepID=A0ABU2L484_9ACTN|nr:phage tail tape measure protein [Streptomyces sp. DSM 44917]MDT0306133.1 phage tail tape measure protein [Streptomyces sp. DSM 44917]